MTREGNIETDIFWKRKIASVQRDELGVMPGTPLHIHHAEWHAGNIEGSDVEDLHASDKPFVKGAPQKAVSIELFLEADEVHGRCHRILCFGILGHSDVNP